MSRYTLADTIRLVPSHRPICPEALLALFSDHHSHGKTLEEEEQVGAHLYYIRVRQLGRTDTRLVSVGYGLFLRIQTPKGFCDECYSYSDESELDLRSC
jgi:hypothetical protein